MNIFSQVLFGSISPVRFIYEGAINKVDIYGHVKTMFEYAIDTQLILKKQLEEVHNINKEIRSLLLAANHIRDVFKKTGYYSSTQDKDYGAIAKKALGHDVEIDKRNAQHKSELANVIAAIKEEATLASNDSTAAITAAQVSVAKFNLYFATTGKLVGIIDKATSMISGNMR